MYYQKDGQDTMWLEGIILWRPLCMLRGTACALICLTSVVIFNHFKMVQIGPDMGRSQAQLTNLPLSRGSLHLPLLL